AVMEIGRICLARVVVPFACEHAPATLLLEGDTDAADAGEQVDESEAAGTGGWLAERQQALADGIGDIGLGLGLAGLPAADGLGIHSKGKADFLVAELLEGSFEQLVDVHLWLREG